MVSEMKKTRFTQLMVWLRFFEDPALLKNHSFNEVKHQMSADETPGNFSSELFHHNRQEWRVTSGPSPPTMAWHRGIGRKSSKDGDLNRSPEKSQPFQNHSISSVLKEKL